MKKALSEPETASDYGSPFQDRCTGKDGQG